MRALRTVGTIVSVVALAATGLGTVLAPGAFALGLGTAGMLSVGAYAGLAAGVIGIASAALAPKPSFSGGGNPQSFQTNPQSGLPYPIGRTRMSGVRIHADTYDATAFKSEGKQDVLAFAVLLGAGGPMQEIETFRADKLTYAFDGSGNATGDSANYMAQKVSLGQTGASALALSFGGSGFPGWTSAHKLSGIAHALWDLRYDEKGVHFGAGVPEPEWIGKWAKVYDPRKDSTYPGGSGSHRALNEATYEWSRNPALHALTWCLGRWQNGKRTLGIGAPTSSIRMADFVEAANVADANEWACGGVEWSTDAKGAVLKRMLQAGGAEPTMTGAMIGCRVNTPRVSIATIETEDLLDSLSIAATRSRRDRFNTVIPRFRSEEHEWEVVSGTPVSVSDYVTLDGGRRSKEIDFPLVQMEGSGIGHQQVGQLAAYEIVNSREAGPIRFTTGPKFFGIKTGDCVTLNVPGEGLVSQPVIIRRVSRDPAAMKFTFEAETETEAKHDFALGATSTPPPTWEPTPPDITPPTPSGLLWELNNAYSDDGHPGILIWGACEFPGADSVLLDYRKVGDPDWITLGKIDAAQAVRMVVAPLDGVTAFEARVAYQSGNRFSDWLNLSPVTTPPAKLAGIDDGATRNVSRGAWAPGVAYADGDLVTYNGSSYLVTTAHTSAGGSPPPNANVALFAAAGSSGTSALSLTLSNPTASILTDADGNNGVFSNATGQVTVKYGGTDVTSSATISEPSGAEVNCTGDVNTATNTPVSGQAKGYYRVTAITADTARYRIRAVYDPGTGPIAQEVDFTLSRQKKLAKAEVLADRAQVNYSIVTGNPTPSTQTTNFTANVTDSAATITWKVFNEAGVEQTPTSSFLSNVTGATTAMTASQFTSAVGAGSYVYVRAYVGNVLTPLTIGSAHLRKFVVPEPQYWGIGPVTSNVRTDGTGALDPATQTTVITATFTGLGAGASVTWTLFDGAGNARTPLATYATVSGTGNSILTMTGAQFLDCANSTGKVRAVATLSGSGTALDGTSNAAQILEVGDGASAIGLSIKKSRDAITYNGQGFIWPASQSIDFTAVRQNLPTGTVTFEVRDGASNLKTPLATYGTVVGDVLTMTETQFELARGQTQTVQVRAYIGSIEGYATVSGTPVPIAGYNEWPDPLLNTADRNFAGGAMAAPFSVFTNGDVLGWKYKNYVRVVSTTSPTTEYFHKVTDKIPVRYDGEKFWPGVSGGVGNGAPAPLMAGIYVLFRNLAGAQVGTTQRIGTANGFTPASNGNWPDIPGSPIAAPAGAAFVEVGYWRDDHGVISASQAYFVAPYIQRSQPAADQTRGAFPSIAPVVADPSGTVILSADWKGLGLASAYRFKYSRTFGGVDVSSSTTWNVTKSMGCNAVINSSGLLTVTPITSTFDPAGFQVRLESTYDGVTETKVIRGQIAFAPPPQVTAASTIVVGALDSFDLTATSYASETVIAGPTIINTGVGTTVAVRAAWIVSADAFGAGTASFNAKAQYRPATGGAWTDAGQTVVPLGQEDPDNFNLRGLGLYTGSSSLTAGTDYEWRIIAYKTVAGHIYGQPKLFALNSGTLL